LFYLAQGGSLRHKNFPSVGVWPNFELENGKVLQVDIDWLVQFKIKSDASLIRFKFSQTKHSLFFNFENLSKGNVLMIIMTKEEEVYSTCLSIRNASSSVREGLKRG